MFLTQDLRDVLVAPIGILRGGAAHGWCRARWNAGRAELSSLPRAEPDSAVCRAQRNHQVRQVLDERDGGGAVAGCRAEWHRPGQCRSRGGPRSAAPSWTRNEERGEKTAEPRSESVARVTVRTVALARAQSRVGRGGRPAARALIGAATSSSLHAGPRTTFQQRSHERPAPQSATGTPVGRQLTSSHVTGTQSVERR